MRQCGTASAYVQKTLSLALSDAPLLVLVQLLSASMLTIDCLLCPLYHLGCHPSMSPRAMLNPVLLCCLGADLPPEVLISWQTKVSAAGPKSRI